MLGRATKIQGQQRLKPLDEVWVYANRTWREGMCLAVKDGQALIEFWMVNYTRLRIYQTNAKIRLLSDFRKFVDSEEAYTGCGYKTISTAWLKAIVEGGATTWIGNPNRHRKSDENLETAYIDKPKEYLAQRLGTN